MSNVGKRGKVSLISRLTTADRRGTTTALRHHEIREVLEAVLSSRQSRKAIATPSTAPEGGDWRTVPVEPTDDMIDRAAAAYYRYESSMREALRAALAAAPQPQNGADQ